MEGWVDWYKRVEQAHGSIWQVTRIADALTLSLAPMDKDDNLLRSIGYFWSNSLNYFLFGSGPMTPTLMDVAMVKHLRHAQSNVWEHFEKSLIEVDGDLNAACKYCGLKLNTKSGTSSLRGHIANACQGIDSATRKRFKASMNKQPHEENFVFDPQICRKAMNKFIIHAEIPFLKLEDPYLQPWINTMQPTFHVRGRHTICSDCLKKYEDMKKELQTELQNLDSHVCLTSDIWTSSQNIGYMVVTAHYVDPEFKLKKKIIWFKELEYPHLGYAISDDLVLCMTDWGIRDKLFTLTLDNVSNNTSACELLIKSHKNELLFEGEHLHVRCSAHILNILVQDVMRLIHSAIEKIHELLKYIDSSVSRLQAFNSIASGMGLRPKAGIYLDIPTRWNSTFKMVREALKYKAALNSYAHRSYELAPSEEEWVKAEVICEFLKAFEELTLAVSAHRTPTAHMFLPLVLCIRHALKDLAWQSTDLLKQVATTMHSKFEKYWDPSEDNPYTESNPRRKKKEIAFNIALVIATFLDPRRKLGYLKFFYKKVWNDANKVDILVKHVLEWIRKYFSAYEERCASESCVVMTLVANEVSSKSESPCLGKRKLEEEFAEYMTQEQFDQSHKSEIDAYLEENVEKGGDDWDILAWWKCKSDKYPVSQPWRATFLQFLLAPCGGRILGDHRSSLSPQMLEALICAKDWLFITNDLDVEAAGSSKSFEQANVKLYG
ncbi:hypothetical protein U9M48_030596 [Paspalum notatum var. saurae]|uniref:BED-type domain-containing protein n=1 Tax=Paspalum notatum var. saurae TaxID=547442 RepID=A0AAQ3U566_PASNO